MSCRPEESAIPAAVSLLPLATNHASDVLDMPVDPNEPTYCLCHQVSYGEMIGCDNQDVCAFSCLLIAFFTLPHPVEVQSIAMSMSVCLSTLSVLSHISKTTHSDFTKFSASVIWDRGSVLLITCTAAFVDDVMFSYSGPPWHVAFWQY